MAVPPPASMGFGFFDYDQLRRSWYVFFFQTPLAEFAVGHDDLAFIDRLWADWSPGYDGAWDAARVKEALATEERLSRRHRLLPGHVRRPPPDDPAAAAAAGGRRARRPPTHAVPPRRRRRLHGARDHRPGDRPPRPGIGAGRWSRAPATSCTSSGPTRSTTTSSGSCG